MFFKRSLLKSVILYTVYLKYLEETELKVLDNNQTGRETLMESLILYNTCFSKPFLASLLTLTIV